MSNIACKPPADLKPLDPQLPAEVQEWVSGLRVIWVATGLSLNQFRRLEGHEYIDKGTISRYLSGQRVPSSSWFLDKLIAIQADNGKPLTPAACEHLAELHMRALQAAHPHEYRVRLVRDELEIALIGKLEAERRACALEEQLAEHSRQIEKLTDDQGQLRASRDADRVAAQADYERLTREVDEISGQLHVARERTVQAERRYDQLKGILDQLDASVTVDEDSVRDFVTTMAHEPDGLVVADEVGRIIVFNRAAARLTGQVLAEVIGKFVFDMLPLRDSDGRDWWVYADPYHGLPTRTRHPERSLYLADGTEVLVSVGYVRDQDLDQGTRRPRPVRRLVISLRGAQERERLERDRTQLIYTVAHELRSPLTSIKGFTATLLSKWGRFTDDQKLVMLEMVNADADGVTRLITELLDVSRIDGGQTEIHRQLVDLPDRARKIIAGRIAAGESEDRFRLEVHSDLPETWLDADKIDSILGELVENAVQHGAGLVTIVVEPAYLNGDEANGEAGNLCTPDAAAVSVRDQGKGIAPEVGPRVFRRFWRGKPRGGSRISRHGGGTGLGLYIVKGLVEAHGGTIGVKCAPDGGAEFRFIVPVGDRRRLKACPLPSAMPVVARIPVACHTRPCTWPYLILNGTAPCARRVPCAGRVCWTRVLGVCLGPTDR